MGYPAVGRFKKRVYECQSTTLATTTLAAAVIVGYRGYVAAAFGTNLGTSTSTTGGVTINFTVNNVSIAGSSAVTMNSTTSGDVGQAVFQCAPTAKTYVNQGDVLAAYATGGSAVPFNVSWHIDEI